MTKTPAQLDREIDDKDLADFVRGAKKYSSLQRARLAYVVVGILRERGVETSGVDDAALVALARAELARDQWQGPVRYTGSTREESDRGAPGYGLASPAARSSRQRSHATVKHPRGMITEEQARTMPRFDFIAHWLVTVTRKKDNRGPLGLWVKKTRGGWQIISPVGGGTVTYETRDPALLFDYVRRGQLGRHLRDAEEFRGAAYERIGAA